MLKEDYGRVRALAREDKIRKAYDSENGDGAYDSLSGKEKLAAKKEGMKNQDEAYNNKAANNVRNSTGIRKPVVKGFRMYQDYQKYISSGYGKRQHEDIRKFQNVIASLYGAAAGYSATGTVNGAISGKQFVDGLTGTAMKHSSATIAKDGSAYASKLMEVEGIDKEQAEARINQIISKNGKGANGEYEKISDEIKKFVDTVTNMIGDKSKADQLVNEINSAINNTNSINVNLEQIILGLGIIGEKDKVLGLAQPLTSKIIESKIYEHYKNAKNMGISETAYSKMIENHIINETNTTINEQEIKSRDVERVVKKTLSKILNETVANDLISMVNSEIQGGISARNINVDDIIDQAVPNTIDAKTRNKISSQLRKYVSSQI